MKVYTIIGIPTASAVGIAEEKGDYGSAITSASACRERQDNEGKRDRKFGGCVSVLPCARDAVRNMRVTAKQRGREQEAGK